MKCDLWFINDNYFTKHPDPFLMPNKIISGKQRKRPCFYAFKDNKDKKIIWLVPLSSKEKKYKTIYSKIIKKYGRCDTLVFGTVLGRKSVFLIQNICPVTKKYIQPYLDKKSKPINIDGRLAKEVKNKTKYVLKKTRNGLKLTFTNINKLYSDMQKENNISIVKVKKPLNLKQKQQKAKKYSQSLTKNTPISKSPNTIKKEPLDLKALKKETKEYNKNRVALLGKKKKQNLDR